MIFFKKREPIHARHLDIEGDHIGHLFGDALCRDKRDRRPCQSLRSPGRKRARPSASAALRRSRPQSAREFWDSLQSLSLSDLPAAPYALVPRHARRAVPRRPLQFSRRRSTSPVPVLKLDMKTGRASQAGCDDVEALVVQHPQRCLAIQSADRRTRCFRWSPANIAASEKLYFDLAAIDGQ